jgi:hypothetical protein
MRHLLNVLGLGALLAVAVATSGCEASDPARSPRCASNLTILCNPEPYRDAIYRPEGERHVVDVDYPQLVSLSQGACNSDGECLQGGCGNDCEAYTVPPHAGTCQAYTVLYEAFCGCVEQRCTWFTQ